MRDVNFRRGIMAAAIALFVASGFANAALERQYLRRLATDDLAQIRQLQRVAEQTHGPNIILAGGSNVIYGFDAAKITRDLRVHTVNIGMMNLLDGPNNYEKLLRSVVKHGDIVVYADSRWFTSPSMQQRQYLSSQEHKTASALAQIGSIEFRGSISSPLPVWTLLPQNPLAAETFHLLHPAPATVRDASGDFKACVRLQSFFPQPAPNGAPARAIFEEVQRIAKLTGERGATLVLVEPPVLIDELQRKSWTIYRAALERGLKPIAPLIMAARLSSNAREFCDTPFHLRPAMRSVRSAQLVSRLTQLRLLARIRARESFKP